MDGTVVGGATRGVVAAAAMTGMRRAAKAAGLVGEAPPDELANRGEGTAWLVRRVPAGLQNVVIQGAHLGFGATAGAAFGTLAGRRALPLWAGPAYGLAIWSLFETVGAPLFGLSGRRHRPLRERAAIAADHVVYGLIVGHRPRE